MATLKDHDQDDDTLEFDQNIKETKKYALIFISSWLLLYFGLSAKFLGRNSFDSIKFFLPENFYNTLEIQALLLLMPVATIFIIKKITPNLKESNPSLFTCFLINIVVSIQYPIFFLTFFTIIYRQFL